MEVDYYYYYQLKEIPYNYNRNNITLKKTISENIINKYQKKQQLQQFQMNTSQIQVQLQSIPKYLQIKSESYNQWGLSCWKKYKNPFLKELFNKSFIDFLKVLKQNQGNVPKDMQQLQRQLPIHQPNFHNQSGQIKVTWIGHSNVVIQDSNITFLIDPTFSQRCSPVQIVGPQRYRRPACQLKELPDKIHAVFISHDHYDHFDTNTIQWLYKNKNPEFFVGLNSRDLFHKKAKVTQLDWNQTQTFTIQGRKYQIYFFPVKHWSKRFLFDTCQRLWGGFIITTPQKKKIFYPGDTGYCPVFKQIGEKFKQIDLALIPIGAFHPRHFMSTHHIDPQQAVTIHKQINSKKSIGVHWGTFPLGFEHYLAPRKQLNIAKQKHKIGQDFICLQHGNSQIIKY